MKKHRSDSSKGMLGRLDVFVLAFGAMIGWGWVALSGEWIGRAGALGAVIAFVIGGILVLFVGLVYAELSAAMPDTDGVLLFSKRALGRRFAYLCTWAILLIAVVTSLAPLLGRNMLTWLCNAGGFATIITYLIVSVSFLLLHKNEPDMPRPYPVKHWKAIGMASTLLSFVMLLLYLPGFPAALVWPYEWAIVLLWTVLGLVLYFLAKRR